MKKLGEENRSMHKKLQSYDRELKKITTTMQNLSENIQILSDKVIKIETENKHLSSQVEKIAKKNEVLTSKITLQTKDISALQRKNRIMTEQNFRPSNDLVPENTIDNISKRIVLHSNTDILSLVTTHGTEIQKLQTDIAALKTDMPKVGSGSTYVRWGRNNCSGNGTELVYSGYAAGSDYQETGAAANYICLSPDPLWGYYNDAHNADAKVMGVEYELNGAAPDTKAFFHKNLHEEDAPCSVCRSSRPTVIMIPGRNKCYKGWTLEYKGYLVAGYYGFAAATEYVCLDDNPDVIPGGHADENGSLFYMVEGRCGRSLTCPPYIDGREITCVVCSK